MRRSSWLFCVFGLVTSMLFPENMAGSFPIHVSYAPSSRAEIAALWANYGSIPGGITLEGKAEGVPRIWNIRYDARQNEFILNGKLRYVCPVSVEKLREIALALKKEDALGFTFQTQDTVYGALSPRGRIIADLKKADLYLGTRVFAPENASSLKKTKADPGNASRGTSVHFRFGNYRFIQEKGRLRVDGSRVRISLIPILRRTDARGNFLPDLQTIGTARGRMPYASQIRKLIENFSEMLHCKAVKNTVRYGEAAAFLRALRSQDTDLLQLFRTAGEPLETGA